MENCDFKLELRLIIDSDVIMDKTKMANDILAIIYGPRKGPGQKQITNIKYYKPDQVKELGEQRVEVHISVFKNEDIDKMLSDHQKQREMAKEEKKNEKL